jgi:nitric oxide synthase oxygenase domain/subunit
MPADLKKAKAALNLQKLKLPSRPRVRAIEVEDYVDWAGDEALRVYVVIDESTTDEELRNGRAILDLKRAIHDSLLKKGITLFPYTIITKPSERFPEDEEE